MNTLKYLVSSTISVRREGSSRTRLDTSSVDDGRTDDGRRTGDCREDDDGDYGRSASRAAVASFRAKESRRRASIEHRV